MTLHFSQFLDKNESENTFSMTYLHINYSSYSRAITNAAEHLCLHNLFLSYCPNFLYVHRFTVNIWFQHLLQWDKTRNKAITWKSHRDELEFFNILKMLCLSISLFESMYKKKLKFCVIRDGYMIKKMLCLIIFIFENMYKKLEISYNTWWLHDKMEASWTNLICLYLVQVSFKGVWLPFIWFLK